MYRKGKDVLPPELLKQVQKYVSGQLIYIPQVVEQKASWGSLSGARQEIQLRNSSIIHLYQEGVKIQELMAEFHLSEDSIKKIVYSKKAVK